MLVMLGHSRRGGRHDHTGRRRRRPADTAADPDPGLRRAGYLGREADRLPGLQRRHRLPEKRGENYIYEGLILRLLKSDWEYKDATNVIAYYGSEQRDQELPQDLEALQRFFAERLVLDDGVRRSIERTTSRVRNTVWVFRYYDLDDRRFPLYGAALVRLIGFIRELASDREEAATGEPPKVNIIAHSMGGLIVREAVQATYPKLYGDKRAAADHINKIVTLGTPHRGISFQLLREWMGPDAQEEIERFNPDFQADETNAASYRRFQQHFPLERLLTVVGTNYRTYGNSMSSLANRLFSVGGEFGPNYNRSDGLVKQAYAQIPGAPRTFVHKCHGGADSLVTSRESFEVAMRFFFGDRKARLRLLDAEVTRGLDVFGKSELFFGVSIKPRGVDFDLFHQTAEAENCYGPFRSRRLDDDPAFSWAGPDRLIWEGWLDSRARAAVDDRAPDLVMRLDVYVEERDSFGLGFSDNIIFRKQYYVQAVMDGPPAALRPHRRAPPRRHGARRRPGGAGHLRDVGAGRRDGSGQRPAVPGAGRWLDL
jgi:hypothetical protein